MKWIITFALFYSFNLFATPVVNFTTSSQVVSEKIRDVAISVELDSPTNGVVRVAFDVSGSATYGADHDLRSGEFIIEPGQTTGTITFRVKDDSLDEGSENIIVDLLSSLNATLGSSSTHQIDIEDMSLDLPVLNWTSQQTTTSEGSTVELSASLDRSSANTVLAFYKVSGTSTYGDDHNLTEGYIEIVPGTLASSIFIDIKNDQILESTETIIIRMISPVNNAQLGNTTRHTININDGVPVTTKWFGTTYATEFESIRSVDGDDNPSRFGFHFDSIYNILENWSQVGSSYVFQDITAYNASMIQTVTDSRVYYFNVPGETRQGLGVFYGGYFADFDFWNDNNSNSVVDAGEVRARIAIAQSQPTPPYSTNRPTARYDFSKLAGNTYTGITIEQGSLTDHNDFNLFDGSGGCTNSLTFGATVTSNISGSICNSASTNITINSDQNLVDPEYSGHSTIAGNHGLYIGGTAYGNDNNVASIAIVASPDGNAIVIASCLNSSCEGNFSDIRKYFNLDNLTDLSSMRFSILIKQ